MRALLILSLLFVGNAALALSCLRPDPMRDFQEADASEDAWIIVTGVLSFDQSAAPKQTTLDNDAPPATDIPARFSGNALTKKGFVAGFDNNITLRIQCFGPWCGSAQSGADYLAFLKKEGSSYVLFANPCGTRLYPDPDAKLRATLKRCMRGQACDPQKPRR